MALVLAAWPPIELVERNVEQTCSRHSRPDRRGVTHHGHPQGQAAEQPHSGHGVRTPIGGKKV